MFVNNMLSERSGREVANQFIIYAGDYTIFQSYNSVIAMTHKGNVYLDENYYNYSRTTSKYLYKFLGTSNIQAKIHSGEYQLHDLNE
jgi:hypothetical protein